MYPGGSWHKMKEGRQQQLKLGLGSLIFNFPQCCFFFFFNQFAHYLPSPFKEGFSTEISVLNPRGRESRRVSLKVPGLNLASITPA